MSKFERTALVVYGHFSQPPRGNPLTNEIGEEADAAPYKNWNDRINQTSYWPNAESGNFERISYSFSEGLIKWLETDAPDTYKRIVEADQKTAAIFAPAGNALATAHNHVILPLARKRDKKTQILWGIGNFERHFGRKPLGFWLPEMAVDMETLVMLVDAGIQYTLLTSKQIKNLPSSGGAGPYWVNLPGDKQIAVFARHDDLSTQLSFNIHNLGGAGFWARETLAVTRKNVGSSLLLATAGETFGHHFAGEEQFLYWLVNHEAAKSGFAVTTLDRYFLQNPPKQTVEIEERTTWSDTPALTEWATGTRDGKKDTLWKGALRRALDNASSDIDHVYEDFLVSYGIDPWELRHEFLPAIFSGISAEDFIAERIPNMPKVQVEQLKVVFQAIRLTQRMYNSYTFTDNDIAGRQPRYAIACAATALSIVQEATGRDLNDRLPADLAVVTSTQSSITGTDMLRDAIEQFNLTLLKT